MKKLPFLLSLLLSVYSTDGSAILGSFKSRKSSNIPKTIEDSLTKVSHNLKAISLLMPALQKATSIATRLEEINPVALSKADKKDLENTRKQLKEISQNFDKYTQAIENNTVELSKKSQLIKRLKDCPQPKTLGIALISLENAKKSKLSNNELKLMSQSKIDLIQKLSATYPKLQLARQGFETTLSVIQKTCEK